MNKARDFRFLEGAVAGGLATICMTLFMFSSKKLGIQGEHPPKRIAESGLALAGNEKPRREKIKLNAVAATGKG